MAFVGSVFVKSGRCIIPGVRRVRGGLCVQMSTAATAPLTDPDLFRARHILVSSEDMAKTCKASLEEGREFAELAKTISECPSKVRGGDLGWFKAGSMAPRFEEACEEANVGEIVTTQTEFGWHVIQLDGKGHYPLNMYVEELAEILQTPELKDTYQYVDVRERGEIATASLDDFTPLPMSEFEQWADSVEKELSFRKSKPTVVMCHHGMRSAQIAYYLAQQGYEQVFNLVGGIDSWSRNVDSSIPTY